MPYRDPEEKRNADRRRYARDGEIMRAAATARYAAKGDEIKAKRAVARDTPEARALACDAQKARYRNLREEVLMAYGGACICCGEAEPVFLEVDHADNNGAAHRREIGRGSARFYRWLKVRSWPQGFRLLCSNCNQGRARNGGTCPHEEKRRERASDHVQRPNGDSGSGGEEGSN